MKRAIALLISVILCYVMVSIPVSAETSNYSCTLGGLWTGEVYEKQDTINTNIGNSFNMHFADFVWVGNEIWSYYICADAYGKMGIGLAKSTDGIHFTNYGCVLSTSPNGWDNTMSSFPGIFLDNGTFYLVYEGSGTNERGAIGLATSTDGVHFTKRGLILDKNSSGWERVNIGTPDLYKVGNTWYLSYHGYDGTDCQIGMAYGTDLFNLTKRSNPVIPTTANGPDAGTTGRRDIVYENGFYYMVYEISTDSNNGDYSGALWGHAFARSTNLLDWDVLPVKNLISQTNDSMGNDGPAFLQINGVTWIYYRVPGNMTRRARLANETNGGANLILEAEGSGMGHQCGTAREDGWQATIADPAGYMVYGGYRTDIPQGEVTAVVKAKIDNNTAIDEVVFRIEAVDMTRNEVIAQRNVTRQQFCYANHYEFFSLPFLNRYQGHTIETRVYYTSKAAIQIDRFLYNYGNSFANMFYRNYEAENLAHQVGRNVGSYCEANTAQDSSGYLVYGPYATDILSGKRTATFRMKIDNNSADNLGVARIEAYDATSGQILASRTITRTQFTATDTFQYFELPFTMVSAGHSMEFRVFYTGISRLSVDRIEII